MLIEKGIEKHSHQLTGLQGDFHLFLDMFLACIHQKIQAVVFFPQVREFEDFWLSIERVYIVDLKGLEIAGHDPAGLLRLGKIAAVPSPLQEGSQHRPIGLALSLLQVNLHSLLPDQGAGGWNVPVNIFRGGCAVIVYNLHPFFKFNYVRGVFCGVDILEQG